MTDRFKGFVVILVEPIREDDAEQTIKAIEQIKGVLSVRPIIRTPELLIAEETARYELRKKLWGALQEVTDDTRRSD